MSSPSLSQYLAFTMGIARQAGRITLRHFRQANLAQSSKSNDWDIVTEADKLTEAYIVQQITQAFPSHHIVGEEGGGMGAPLESADYQWIVDPIDGTVNYAKGIPYYSVSIALADKNRQPLIGVVYNPPMDELFSAERGAGAQVNGMPLQVSSAATLQQSILVTGFAYDRRTNPDNNAVQASAFVPIARDIRRFGSAALDLCYVAAGRADGFWERSLNAWDVMAGVLMVREAGGVVTDYAGNHHPVPGFDGRTLASNGRIHSAMMDVLRKSYAGAL
jgi:myo-inositol-1(or 4)-monophosphatase